MRIRLLIVIVVFLSADLSAQSKVDNEILSSKEISDIIAKSIYVYSQSKRDSDSTKRERAIIDLQDNLSILDTIMFGQIEDYLKYSRAIINAVDKADLVQFSSISNLHRLLYNGLQELLTPDSAKEITTLPIINLVSLKPTK